jgi:hypothetical protein
MEQSKMGSVVILRWLAKIILVIQRNAVRKLRYGTLA